MSCFFLKRWGDGNYQKIKMRLGLLEALSTSFPKNEVPLLATEERMRPQLCTTHLGVCTSTRVLTSGSNGYNYYVSCVKLTVSAGWSASANGKLYI